MTNNRTSMSVHLAEHIAQNRHVPGIFILNPKLSMGQNIDEPIFIAEAAFEKPVYSSDLYIYSNRW